MTAALLGFVWAIWPLAAITGGQAFSVLSPLVALLLLPQTLLKFRARAYMLPLVGFIVFTVLSAGWSPRDLTLIDIDIAHGKFNVRAEFLRVGLLLIWLAVIFAAANRMSEEGRRRVAAISQGSFLVLLLILTLITPVEGYIFDAVRPQYDTTEGVQNVSRACELLAVAMPILLMGLMEGRPRRVQVLFFILVAGLTIGICYWRGVDGALGAILAAVLAMLIVHIMPRFGFRLLAIGLSGLVLAAPMIFGLISRGADANTATSSLEHRRAIWQRTVEIIAENPVAGGGVGVLRTIDEPIASGLFEGQSILPNHPHNMLLQLWAEMGLIGALLVSAAILLAGWRIQTPGMMRRQGLRIAAFIGGMTAIACTSFDLWNDWWWASAGWLATLIIALPRRSGPVWLSRFLTKPGEVVN